MKWMKQAFRSKQKIVKSEKRENGENFWMNKLSEKFKFKKPFMNW